MKDVQNDQGLELLDIYCLNYWNIVCFFYVCKTTKNSVFLMEIGLKRYKNGAIFCNNFRASKRPLVILENNTFTKSTYEVFPMKLEKDGEYMLPINITENTPIYKLAKSQGKNPVVGTTFALKICDLYDNWKALRTYWLCDNFIKGKIWSA